MTSKQYESLKASGMMYEFFPKATGNYEVDCKIAEEHVISELKRLQGKSDTDTEMAHCDADDLLCRFLGALGYDEMVTAFKSIGKWYA
jgi:hypothetical protein